MKTNRGDKMIHLWEDAIDAHPSSIRVWEGYISYRQSTFNKFTVSSMREVFTSAIQTLLEQDEKIQKAKGTSLKLSSMRTCEKKAALYPDM